MIIYLFDGHTRELYKIIKPLLYKGLVDEVIKENYVSVYKLENKKVIKREVKKVIFITEKDEELQKILGKNNKFRLFNI